MKVVLEWFRRRWLRLLGGSLVFLSSGLLLFLFLLDLAVGLHNPYLGIITYLILPTILAIGLAIVPFDAWLRGRRRRAGRGEPEYPVIDLCDPIQRKIAEFFVISGVVILMLLTGATYKGVEFMDTVTFCGQVCHKVMTPEFTAYKRSPHASVACIECHIGPGAPWFVRSKISGIPQIYHYTKKDYPRPIPTPVAALRPSRDTCENCHWPQRFYGDLLRTKFTYALDERNTQSVQEMLMRVGSGGIAGSGIHSHIVSKIHYLPANEKRTEIARVYVRRRDGTRAQYVNPAYEKIGAAKGQELRFMDCIDCHNRPAHHFDTYEELIDTALTQGDISREIPYIKREILEAAGDLDRIPSVEEQKKTLKRIADLPNRYQELMPDVYQRYERQIRSAARTAFRLYQSTYFPHMRVGPGTYPDWRTHEGCFRCHGVLVDEKTREPISQDCNLCHTLPGAMPDTHTAASKHLQHKEAF